MVTNQKSGNESKIKSLNKFPATAFMDCIFNYEESSVEEEYSGVYYFSKVTLKVSICDEEGNIKIREGQTYALAVVDLETSRIDFHLGGEGGRYKSEDDMVLDKICYLEVVPTYITNNPQEDYYLGIE